MSYQRFPIDTEEKRDYARVELQNIQVAAPGQQPEYVPIAQNQLPADYIQVVPQPQVTIPPPPTPEQLKETLRTRRVEFSTCKYLGEGLTFLRYNWCTVLLIMVTWILIFVLVQIGSFLLIRGATMPWAKESDSTSANFTDVTSLVYRLAGHHFQGSDIGSEASDAPNGNDFQNVLPRGARVGLMIMMVLQQILILNPALASLFAATFKAMRDNARLKWKDSFMCFQCPYYRKLVPLTIILLLGRFIGFQLFIAPGIVFSFFTMFAIPLHHQFRHLSGWQAIKHSFWVVRKHFCALFLFAILLGIINTIGLLLVGIGLLVTVPFTFFSFCYCYHHLVGVTGVAMTIPASFLSSPSPSPTTHTPTLTPTLSVPTSVAPAFYAPVYSTTNSVHHFPGQYTSSV